MEFSNFSEELRIKSKEVHAKSDRLVQLKLAVALTNTKLYQQVLCDFHSIFEAIEKGITKNNDHPLLQDLWKSYLRRTELVEDDLDFYAGLGWKDVIHPSPSALEYASRIEKLTEEEPELLVAYIHTMYLAVFSGGHIIRGIVSKTLGIPGPDGLKLFNVPKGKSRGEIKQHIKETINGLNIDRETKDRIIQEKIDIFRRNNLIVASIQPTVGSFTRIFKFVCMIIAFVACLFLLRNW